MHIVKFALVCANLPRTAAVATLPSVVTGSSENCLSDAAIRPANSAAQGAPK
jgi:hypothetical protein